MEEALYNKILDFRSEVFASNCIWFDFVLILISLVILVEWDSTFILLWIPYFGVKL